MEGISQTLTFEEVIEFNRLVIERYGGLFIVDDDNLSNRNSLLYILETLDETVFGQERYPSVFLKAAALGWNIIAKHVFHDGNKRTGMFACVMFLGINGYVVGIDDVVLDEEVVEVALAIATNKLELTAFAEWLKARSTKMSEEVFMELIASLLPGLINDLEKIQENNRQRENKKQSE